MAISVSQPALNVREELTKAQANIPYIQLPFWFVGDGTETDFLMPKGWKPLFVYDAGALKKEGSGDDYTITFDGFEYTVSFVVAPTNLNDVGIMGVLA